MTYGLLEHVVPDAAALDRLLDARATQLAAHPSTALGLAKTLALLGQPDLMQRFAAVVPFIKSQVAVAE